MDEDGFEFGTSIDVKGSEFSVSPLQVVFNVNEYLSTHSQIETFDMIQRLRAACE